MAVKRYAFTLGLLEEFYRQKDLVDYCYVAFAQYTSFPFIA